eukprot:m51a1_g13964 hypothetical protein (153) ;mRNA; f:967081-967706
MSVIWHGVSALTLVEAAAVTAFLFPTPIFLRRLIRLGTKRSLVVVVPLLLFLVADQCNEMLRQRARRDEVWNPDVRHEHVHRDVSSIYVKLIAAERNLNLACVCLFLVFVLWRLGAIMVPPAENDDGKERRDRGRDAVPSAPPKPASEKKCD